MYKNSPIILYVKTKTPVTQKDQSSTLRMSSNTKQKKIVCNCKKELLY